MILNVSKTRKLLLLATVFLLVTFALTFFHQHADGQHQLDCSVCRLVQQFVLTFGLMVTALISGVFHSGAFQPAPFKKLHSFLFATDLQNRAPPVLA